MSFTLRQIARRSGGGPDIIREKPLAAAEPVIGRGADCDVVLNDLAVGLHHARLRDLGDARVLVEALGPVGMQIDGAFTRRKEVSAISRPRIVIGSHILELSPSAAGEVIIEVSRVVAGDGVAAVDPRRVFSLMEAGSKRRTSYVFLATVLLLCLALPIFAFLHGRSNDAVTRLHSDKQWSSGPLSRGHAFLNKNCNACHQRAFVPVRDSACLACHRAGVRQFAAVALAKQMRQQGSQFIPAAAWDHAEFDRLLRARPDYTEIGYRINMALAAMFDHPQSRCASCHTEHVGSRGQRATGNEPPLPSSNQVKVDCAECHSSMSHRLPDTQLADAANWNQHPEFRPFVTVSAGPTAKLARARAYSRTDRTGLFFSHRQHLVENGGVARMAERLGAGMGYGKPLECANCHRARGEGFVPVEMKQDCSACHSLGYASKGGRVMILPHGKPGEVVAALEDFYAEGGPRDTFALSQKPFTARATPIAQGAPQNPAQMVERGVRAAFLKGGTCYGCHTILPPLRRGSLLYRVAAVNLIQRYLPSGDFDHSIREHKQDAHGRPICLQCHRAKNSNYSSELLIPRVAQCHACHGRPKPLTATPAGASCSECHAYHQPGTSARRRSNESLTF